MNNSLILPLYDEVGSNIIIAFNSIRSIAMNDDLILIDRIGNSTYEYKLKRTMFSSDDKYYEIYNLIVKLCDNSLLAKLDIMNSINEELSHTTQYTMKLLYFTTKNLIYIRQKKQSVYTISGNKTLRCLIFTYMYDYNNNSTDTSEYSLCCIDKIKVKSELYSIGNNLMKALNDIPVDYTNVDSPIVDDMFKNKYIQLNNVILVYNANEVGVMRINNYRIHIYLYNLNLKLYHYIINDSINQKLINYIIGKYSSKYNNNSISKYINLQEYYDKINYNNSHNDTSIMIRKRDCVSLIIKSNTSNRWKKGKTDTHKIGVNAVFIDKYNRNTWDLSYATYTHELGNYQINELS